MTALEPTAAAYIVMHAAAYDRATLRLARDTLAVTRLPAPKDTDTRNR